MTLNLLYLKYFCDAVTLGGVTAAARANFVTQSAISQGISKLEKSLGCPLLARHPNRFRLTPEGQQAFQELSEILRKASDFQENFPVENRNILGSLEFACTRSFALTVIPDYLKRFRSEHPEVKMNFFCSGRPDYIKQLLKEGAIDFAITQDTGNFSGLDQTPIYNGTYGLYTSHKVTLEEEAELGFILPVPEDTTSFKQAYYKQEGKKPHVVFEVEGWEAVAHLASEGLGIGYFPDFLALKKPELRKSRYSFTLPPYQISAFYPEGMKLRKSSEIFLSYFSNSK